MIAPFATLERPPALEAPAVVVPAPYEVSFGRIAGTVGPGTRRVVVQVQGRTRAAAAVRGRRFGFSLSLPRRDVTVRVVAFDAAGRRAAASVGPVYGLPGSAAPRPALGWEEPALARRVRALARAFPGTAAVYLQDLRTGAGAAWNARARFPAASTLKLAIAVAVMRALRGPPAPGSALGTLLGKMLVHSDNAAANALEVWLGGSTSGGSARVDATMRALGLLDSEMYGGYELEAVTGRRPIPVEVRSQPRFGVGKYTTAWDLARLHRYLHLAAVGRGPLVRAFAGAFTPAEARYLLFELAHSTDRGKLDRYVAGGGGVAVLHKAGWLAAARHDSGLVYWPGGVFVATVMTWNGSGVGSAGDVLAGLVARAGLERFRALARAPRRRADASSVRRSP